MTREHKVQDIMKHADKIGANRLTLLSALAFKTDKEMTKYRREFLTIKKFKPEEQ